MKLFGFIKKALSSKEEKAFDSIIDEVCDELKSTGNYHWSVKPKDLKTTDNLLALPDKQKVGFILYAIKAIHAYNDGRTSYAGSDPQYVKSNLQQLYLSHLFKVKMVLDEEDVEYIVSAFLSFRRGQWANVSGWPLSQFVTQVERNFEQDKISQKVRDSLTNLKSAVAKLNRSDKDTIKLVDKLETYLFESGDGKVNIRPALFFGDDQFALYANSVIAALGDDDKIHWYALILHAQKANGAKPSTKYIDQGRALVKDIGNDKFKNVSNDWFEFIIKQKEITQAHTNTYQGREYTYNSVEFLNAPTLDALKGIIWMCSQFHDTRTLHNLAALCERSFKKIPGKGPAAASVGNACLYTLYKSKGLEGIAHLSRLKLRIKQNNTQNLIEKYLQEAAKAEGISVMEIEDLAVDDYGLKEGKREYLIDDYKAVIKIQGIGDVLIEWYKPDGTPQKSVPSVVQDKHKEKLKKIKDTAKQIEIALTAQRDRIDRMFRSERKMSWEYFTKHYFMHGLLSFLAKDILWNFEAANKTSTALYVDGQWTTLNADVYTPEATHQVSLWHPATSTVHEIRSWREFLMSRKILQPIKQAYREVYLLTDAEVNTRTYSNRMAAHILKQHQFNSLAKARGWKYSLLGAYDDGRDNEEALLNFPENKLRAEFWVSEVNADNAFNDTGIWNYVSTDQIRFVNTENNEPAELINIPPVVFSEVMRDVDLFVGVASVGNDPNWRDNGGIPAYRDYWQAFSFGELTEIAKTRKEILENLVPRLKIASVATIKDKFLVVKGKKRTYKIHLGSTNILMEPNDQYLCIVPDRSKKDTTSQVFLPFEGDAGLSVIISKAILLSEDDKITDPTILSQINFK